MFALALFLLVCINILIFSFLTRSILLGKLGLCIWFHEIRVLIDWNHVRHHVGHERHHALRCQVHLLKRHVLGLGSVHATTELKHWNRSWSQMGYTMHAREVSMWVWEVKTLSFGLRRGKIVIETAGD